ncbi:MAG: hypothetical protein L0I62_02170 [Gammaproteobacteria bacterium]|nr:hypothetical protein [Gammaproteobacteria bacterium]
MKVAFCACLLLMIVLAGCASSPGSGERDLVYDPPPPPASFDLVMYLTAKYMHAALPLRINGRDYSFDGAMAYIKEQKAKKPGPYTVLLHGVNGGDVKLGGYMCFVFLMFETGAIGYTGAEGEKPDAPETTIVGGDYTNLLGNCRTP